jgi:hypothetical protein
MKTFLVGERVTLADIAVSTTLLPLYERVRSMHFNHDFIVNTVSLQVFAPEHRAAYGNVNRWFVTCVNQPQFKAVVGDAVLAQTEAKPDGLTLFVHVAVSCSHIHTVAAEEAYKMYHPEEAKKTEKVKEKKPAAEKPEKEEKKKEEKKEEIKQLDVEAAADEEKKEKPWKYLLDLPATYGVLFCVFCAASVNEVLSWNTDRLILRSGSASIATRTRSRRPFPSSGRSSTLRAGASTFPNISTPRNSHRCRFSTFSNEGTLR